jgi:hypothetical protein
VRYYGYFDVCNRVHIWCETAECYREAVVEACHNSINTIANSTDNSTATASAADDSTPATAGAIAGADAASTHSSSLYTGKSSTRCTLLNAVSSVLLSLNMRAASNAIKNKQ